MHKKIEIGKWMDGSWRVMALLGVLAWGFGASAFAQKPYNVLFIIADDFTAEALGCYGNTVCQTPNIDSLAAEGVKYTRTYCQYAVCGPSRASLMFSYYPDTTDVFGMVSGRGGIGNADRETWSQYFKNRGYYSARVSKIYHMRVPNDIRLGSNGTDDALSWTERFNAQGGEAEDTFAEGRFAPGTVAGWASKAERLQGFSNANGEFPGVDQITGNNTYEYVITPEDADLPYDDWQSDGKAGQIACDLIDLHKDEPFFLAVGFVRPHIPFVAPASYFEMYPWADMAPPIVQPGDQDDVVWKGVTTASKIFNDDEKKKSIGAYYASTSYMDHQVGRVLQKLEDEGLEDNTIVIFTADHGYFLGEHDFWSKQYVHEESSRVPLIIKVPGKSPAVCDSFVELLDLYPTLAELCGLPVPTGLQGVSQAGTLDDPDVEPRSEAFSIFEANNLYLLRDANYAFIQRFEDGSGGYELYDMVADPYQITSLAANPAYGAVLEDFKDRMVQRLQMLEGHRDDHSLWLPFNQTSGTNTFDANGMERGTLKGFPDQSSHWVEGKYNRSCNFNHTNQYIDVSGFTPPSGTLDCTVSAWINTTSNGTISMWGSTAFAGSGWNVNVTTNGKFQVEVGNGSITSQTPVNDGQWHHVAAAFASDLSPNVDDIALYIDGQPEPSPAVVPQSLNIADGRLVVGKYRTDGGSVVGTEVAFGNTGAVDGATNYVVSSGGVTMTVVPTSSNTADPDTIGIYAVNIGVTGGIGDDRADRTVDENESLTFSFDQDVLLRGFDKNNALESEITILTSPAFDGLTGVVGGTYSDAGNSISDGGHNMMLIDDGNSSDGILIPQGTPITFTVSAGSTVSYEGIVIASLGESIPTVEGNAFVGKIDEYRVDLRAWSTSEILEQYETAAPSSDAWILANYGAANAFDWTADTESDGLNALEEYAYGNDPLAVDDPPRMPVGAYNPATGKIEFTFPQRVDGSHELSYTVAVSDDLETWRPDVTIVSTTPTGEFFEDVVAESDEVSGVATQLFMKVEVEL